MTMHATSGPPRAGQQQIAVRLTCTLTRAAGSPIGAETIDVGTTGMRLTTDRPLAVDETVSFDLPVRDAERLRGSARVVSEERPGVYVLRFGRLTAPMARCLRAIVTELSG